jgi:hypothetical protein
MLWKELCHIVCLAMHHHPAVLLGAVLGNLLPCQRHIQSYSENILMLQVEEREIAGQVLPRYYYIEHDAVASREYS